MYQTLVHYTDSDSTLLQQARATTYIMLFSSVFCSIQCESPGVLYDWDNMRLFDGYFCEASQLFALICCQRGKIHNTIYNKTAICRKISFLPVLQILQQATNFLCSVCIIPFLLLKTNDNFLRISSLQKTSICNLNLTQNNQYICWRGTMRALMVYSKTKHAQNKSVIKF